MEQYRGMEIEMDASGRFSCPECGLWHYASAKALRNAIDKRLAQRNTRAARRVWRAYA